MSSKNDGGHAFPQHGWTGNPEVLARMKNQGGLSIRDYFAGQALAGVLANHTFDMTNYEYTDYAYKLADAMLAERSRTDAAE